MQAGEALAHVRRWLAAYRMWRAEQTAIAQLHAMSDRLLQDIGLTRSEIAGAVRYNITSDGAYRRPAPRRSAATRRSTDLDE